jgi:hypothetical protein
VADDLTVGLIYTAVPLSASIFLWGWPVCYVGLDALLFLCVCVNW